MRWLGVVGEEEDERVGCGGAHPGGGDEDMHRLAN